MGRRRLLRCAPSLVVASSVPLFGSSLGAAKPVLPAALLVPTTGEHAALGRSMARAAKLAQGTNDAKLLLVFDTGGTPEGATAAAKAARRGGARVLLGPVLAREVPPVVAVAGSDVPVIAFSNDAALRESGAFVLGLTAAQTVTAVMRYAAAQGIRRLAVAGGTTGWGGQVRSAAIEAGKATGIDVTIWSEAGASPDAVLLPDVASLAQVATKPDKRPQLLGAFSGFDFAPDSLRAMEGAWLAAPDPDRFSAFAHAFEDSVGGPPGLIAGLAYDAVSIVQQMRQRGGVDRSTLLASAGFKGVCGTVHFRQDGSAARALAIMTVKDAGLRVLDAPTA